MCSLLNRSPDQPIEGSVILRDGAPDYSFIHVESFGHVTSYAPRLSSGDYYHYVWLRPEGGLEVRVPVAIHLEMGTVDINLEFSSQVTERNCSTQSCNHRLPARLPRSSAQCQSTSCQRAAWSTSTPRYCWTSKTEPTCSDS